MRETVRSKGRFYLDMAAEVEPFEDAGGPAVARAARFLADAARWRSAPSWSASSTCLRVRHRDDGGRNGRGAGAGSVAQARRPDEGAVAPLGEPGGDVGARPGAGSHERRGRRGPEDLARLQREGDLDGAIALQAGRLAT